MRKRELTTENIGDGWLIIIWPRVIYGKKRESVPAPRPSLGRVKVWQLPFFTYLQSSQLQHWKYCWH